MTMAWSRGLLKGSGTFWSAFGVKPKFCLIAALTLAPGLNAGILWLSGWPQVALWIVGFIIGYYLAFSWLFRAFHPSWNRVCDAGLCFVGFLLWYSFWTMAFLSRMT